MRLSGPRNILWNSIGGVPGVLVFGQCHRCRRRVGDEIREAQLFQQMGSFTDFMHVL